MLEKPAKILTKDSMDINQQLGIPMVIRTVRFYFMGTGRTEFWVVQNIDQLLML